jgi:hypothetical protein
MILPSPSRTQAAHGNLRRPKTPLAGTGSAGSYCKIRFAERLPCVKTVKILSGNNVKQSNQEKQI